jgi:hypothetical protein
MPLPVSGDQGKRQHHLAYRLDSDRHQDVGRQCGGGAGATEGGRVGQLEDAADHRRVDLQDLDDFRQGDIVALAKLDHLERGALGRGQVAAGLEFDELVGVEHGGQGVCKTTAALSSVSSR